MRSKDCVKYPEWKRDQERKNKNKQSNQQTNDCHNELTIGTDNQTNNQMVVSKNILNDHAIVQSSSAAASSELALLMSADANYEKRNILETKNAIAEIMLHMRDQNLEKSVEKNLENVSIPGSRNFGHTSPDMFCTIIDPVHNHMSFDNITGSTNNVPYHKLVHPKNSNSLEALDCTVPNKISTYTVQKCTTGLNMKLDSSNKYTDDSVIENIAHVQQTYANPKNIDSQGNTNSSSSTFQTNFSVEDETMIGYF